MNNDYLSHHGIKGQSWGVQHGPPYPVERAKGGEPKKTTIVKSKLKAVSEKLSAARADYQKTYSDRAAEIRANRARKAAEKHEDEFEKLKKQVVKHPADLHKYKDQFSREEINQLIDEIEFDRKVKDVKVAEIKRRLDSYTRVKDAMATTYQFMNNAKNIYNIIVDINNAVIASGKSKGKPMQYLGSNDQNKGQSNDKQQKNQGQSNNGKEKKPNK